MVLSTYPQNGVQDPGSLRLHPTLPTPHLFPHVTPYALGLPKPCTRQATVSYKATSSSSGPSLKAPLGYL